MRKILTLTCHGLSTASAVARSAAKTTFGLALAVTFCCSSNASAQTLAQTLAPTASQGVATAGWNAPFGQSSANTGEFPTVGASYSVLTDDTDVELASYSAGLGRGRNAAHSVANPCETGCDVSYYVNYEALWLRREKDERFSLSRNSFIPDWQYEFGGRYTVGWLDNCTNGWEAVYTGPFDWQRQATVLGAANLQSNFVPSGGFTGAQLTSFNNADVHTQSWRAQLNSFELNRRWWTWDVLSTMIGVRYIDYEEDYAFLSSSAAGLGRFTEQTDNQMVGAQVGGDLLYPVSLRSNIGFRGKAGVYANFSDRATFLSNAGTLIINSGDSKVDAAGLIEMGIFGNYQVVPSIRLTAGYEFWYMPGIATVPEQRPNQINPSTGTNIFNEDDLFLHGGSIGVQVLF